jgi:hypothetical protein
VNLELHDIFETRTRCLPACSLVPQRSMLPRYLPPPFLHVRGGNIDTSRLSNSESAMEGGGDSILLRGAFVSRFTW